ncbi:MAG: valine--tRNA ligase [Candidatus Delongbacteria bacterium]|jgi:valyl-tRNA synthetase|nr:valine--tRNA ligase [Candidatus Delongbacteria bacterium]
MTIPSKYSPDKTESKWYKQWMNKGFFHSEPDNREPYVNVIPPPNVTGVLHMGHMLNNTIQDILVRRARMLGKNTVWVPGTDHASIATEAMVVNKLREEGINKSDISRDEFMKHAWEWKEKHGGIILEQLKKLGASCDWERTAFTMDEPRSESVIKVFIDLYKKGLIYRGVRMVNWDPQAKTAVSDEEVVYTEEKSKLYYVRYQVADNPDEYVTIATTRPETILGDTAVCINPNDKRFAHLKGKRVVVPMVNRIVHIIEDEYVDMEFGTGCLKITPAHDVNDYEIGVKHNLDSIDIFNNDGTLNEKAELFVGTDRFEARELTAKELEKCGALIKTEDYINKIGRSERTDSVIEPKLSMQWFVEMKKLAKPALDAVMNDEIKLHPPKFKNTYRHWMENVRDWCISRQLWWGHRIPAWYLPGNNDYVVAETEEEALKLAREKTNDPELTINDLRQDEDVLDTWFSSWLWPISVFDGIRNPENEDFKYYYPTNDLITAPEILFFWVARMIMAGYEYPGEKPFSNVYLHGIVRDTHRRKMSKSLGNSPDPIKLMDKYGADGVRMGMLLCSPAGGDLLYNDNLPEQGRNFANKIWNAFRLVKSWDADKKIQQPPAAAEAVKWFNHKLNDGTNQLNKQFDEFRLSEALMTVYRLFWDDFCSWYLEIIKPAYQEAIDKHTLQSTIGYFETLLKLLHPFMPFITEEIWHLINKRDENNYLIIANWPDAGDADEKLLMNFELTKEVVSNIRTIRKEKNIPMKDALDLSLIPHQKTYNPQFEPVITKLCKLSSFKHVDSKIEGAAGFMVNTNEYYLPVGELINTEDEINKLEKDLNYNKGFLKTVMKKLSNERFVNNAPEQVVEKEKQKKADAEENIRLIQEQLKNLKQ